MTTAQSLLTLLASIKGHEPVKMNPAELELFRATSVARFREATTFLTSCLADVAGSRIEGYLSEVVPPASQYDEDWLCSHLIIESQRLERFLDAPEKVRMLAAMAPPIAFKLDLFAEAHHPGYSHAPHFLLRIECHDDPALTLFENALSSVADVIQPICEATEQFRLVACEGGGVYIVRPSDLAEAVAAGVAAIRVEAVASDPDPDMRFLEGFGLEVVITAETPPEVVAEGIRILLAVFDSVVESMQLMRGEPTG